MSRDTRGLILKSARALLEDADGAPISMGQVAAAAGVTRQLLYFHFDSRAQLLLQVAADADSSARTAERQARVDDAPDGRAALHEAVALQGHIKPRIYRVAQAVDRLRHSDADAAAVWDERERARLDRCRAVVARLDGEGRLRDGWTVPIAAELMWSVTSLRAWEELVKGRAWSTRRWVKLTTALLEAALIAPPDAARGRSSVATT